MRVLAFCLSLLLLACVAVPSRGAECVMLQPGPGLFEGSTELLFSYHGAVNRLFFSHEQRTAILQMVRLSPGEPNEEAVYIIDKEEFNMSHRHDYELVTVRAVSSILGAVMKDGAAAVVPVDSRRVPVDAALVEELQKTWQEMIRRARFASSLDVKPLGTDYHFTAQLDIGPGSAYVEGPPSGSCPGMFAALGAALIRYARVDAKDRAAVREQVFRQARELRARVTRPVPVAKPK